MTTQLSGLLVGGAPRAMFYASATAPLMLRGSTVAYSPDEEGGSGGGEPAPSADAAPGADESGAGENPTPEPEDGGERDDEDLGDDPTAQAEGEGQPKPKKSARERIDELTWKVREAERREQELLDRLAKRDEPKEDQPAAEDAATVGHAEDARPDPDDYEFGVTDERFIEDLADWKVGQRLKQNDEQQTARREFQRRLDTFAAKTAETFPEGEPEGLKAYKALPDAGSLIVQQMVIDSDVGPRLADHLGSNPAEIKRISGLHPLLQAREIGKLEARLSAPSAPAPPAPAPVKTVSDAPPPPATPVRGAGGKFQVPPTTDDFKAFEATYGNRPTT